MCGNCINSTFHACTCIVQAPTILYYLALSVIINLQYDPQSDKVLVDCAVLLCTFALLLAHRMSL